VHEGAVVLGGDDRIGSTPI